MIGLNSKNVFLPREKVKLIFFLPVIEREKSTYISFFSTNKVALWETLWSVVTNLTNLRLRAC